MNIKLFKKISLLLLLVVSISLFQNCSKDNDDEIETDTEIILDEVKDFIWKSMNLVYLYKDQVPLLDEDRFGSMADYNNFLNNYSSPEALFNAVLYEPETVDRFSWMTDDYIELEQQLGGVFKTNGLEYFFYYEPNSDTDVVGVVSLVLHDSDAENNGVVRGQIFHAVDGIEMNVNNYYTLFGNDTYTLSFADYNTNGTQTTSDDTIVPNNTSVTLTKQIGYVENPIYYYDIIEIDGNKIGYLAYNGFTAGYNEELNSIFGDFKSANVTNLVLDLRYNLGGRADVANYLASMITGQFTGEVFSKLKWNETLSNNNSNTAFTNTLPNGGGSINSLNLNKVYIIATGRSASASEMMINNLRPYIEVVHVGTNTVGKTQASLTVYDSPGVFDKDGINPNHTYALQPLIANFYNVNDGSVPPDGFTPNIELQERLSNFGTLGDPDETLLAAAISDILGTGRRTDMDSYFRQIESPLDKNQPDFGLILDPKDIPVDFKLN
ncbi:S41 family peptidase [Aegicerativicinus sediminis]